MTQVNIPEERKWTQPNTSVLFGNLYETKNIDFSLPGFVKIAHRTRYVGREDTSTATFENLLSIIYMSPGDLFGTKKYYYLTNDKIYTSTAALGSFADLGVASPPTTALVSDAIASGIYYIVSTDTEVYSYAGGPWVANLIAANGGAAMTSTAPHPLCLGFDGSILVTDRNKVNKFTTTTAGNPNSYTASVIVFPLSFSVYWIRTFNDMYWFGTRNLINGNAAVFTWDASASSFNAQYDVDCQWIYSGCDWQGNFYIMTNDGRLMSFNGAGFTEVARLPAYTDILTQNNYQFGNAFSLGSIFQRGMAVIDGKIHVMVNAQATTDAGDIYPATQRMPSGIWVYDPEVGFYHKYAASNSSAATDFGQMALAAGGGAISPTFTDPSAAAAISSSTGGTLLYGARLNSATTTEYFTLGSVTSGENRGYFATGRIESPEMQESWRTVFLKYEQLQNSTDAIVVKYKTEDREGLPFTTTSNVTWTSTTTFTSTDTKFANVLAGDEVTVLTGGGAGMLAHVSTISYSNPTYTVTIDEANANVVNTNVGKVALDNYSKISPSITESTVSTEAPEVGARSARLRIPLNVESTAQAAPSEWIQFKVELRGEDVRLSAMSILSETQVKIII
jgi:hypothetical protein